VSVTFNVLPMDGAVFRCWAQLMHRQSDTLYEDAMIAAIARIHRLTVVTRNVADFSRFDVPLLNPFTGAGELSCADTPPEPNSVLMHLPFQG
jgi:hypothetical protein